MSTERVDIVVSETGASTVKRSLDDLATSADKAGGSTSALQAEIERLKSQNSALQQELQKVSAVMGQTEEFAQGLAEGMRDVLDAEVKAGRITAQVSEDLKSHAGALATAAEQATQLAPALKDQATEVERTAKTWKEFVKERMGPYMKELGGHGPAIKKIGEEWKAYRAEMEAAGKAIPKTAPAPPAPSPVPTPGSPSAPPGPGPTPNDTFNLLAWKKEAGRTREAAQFLTNSLGGLAAQSGALGGVLRLGTTALIGGGGLLIALEAVHATVGIVTGAIDKYQQEQEEAKRTTEEHAKALRALSTETRNYTDSLAGGPSQVLAMRAAMRALADEAAPLEEKLRKLREEQEAAAIASAESGMDQGSSFAVEAEKAQKELDRLNDKRRATQNEFAQRAAAETDQQRLEAERRGAQLIAKQIEERRTFGQQSEALEQRFASDSVRIWGEARRQIADLEANTGLLSPGEIERRKRALRSAAAEEVTRAREVQHARLFAAQQGLSGLGASPVQQAQFDAESKLMALAVEYDQAKRAHNAERMDEIRRLIALESEAGSKRVAMAEAAMAAERAANLVAQERAQFVQSRSPEQAETDAEKAARNIREAEEITQRWRVARNLEAGGGTLLGAQRITQIELEFRREREILEQAAREFPAMRAQIEIAQTDIVRREARARAQAEFDAQRERISDQYEFFSTLSALQMSSSREVAAVGKAAAVAQATIDGILAVQKALASSPPPWNYANAAAVGAVAAANIARIQGFESGGWTGYGPTGAVAGVTHGQEFVVRAGPAARNRGALEAMNRGEDLTRYAGATAPARSLNVRVVNNAAGVAHDVVQLGPDEVEIIARRVVDQRAGRAAARTLHNPNSELSTALKRTHSVQPRRNG